MDKFVTGKLPPGFRFQPQIKRLCFNTWSGKYFHIHCLLRSFQKSPFPVLVSGVSQQAIRIKKCTFFINKANYGNLNPIIIPTRAGFWRAVGQEKRIVCSKTKPLVGIKRTLVFYETGWIMHEYCITALTTAACTIQLKKKILLGSLVPIGNWVLCHLSIKKTSDHKGKIDYMSAGLWSYSSTSLSSSWNSSMDSGSSSILTEVSSDIVSNDETNDQ